MNPGAASSSPASRGLVREPAGEIDDEALLEALFDRVVDLLSEGSQIDVEALLEGRDRLRERAEDLVRLARQVAVRAQGSLPAVPGYEIERELGCGGMGAVYLARQTRVGGRRVALKVLPALATASVRARERFVTEIRALSKLDHPNVVAIHDVVRERDICAYAMDWVEGGSLADVIRSGAPEAGVRITFFCRVALAIARALAAAHTAGIVHRDVKPSNILLAKDGTPLLSDFGLARDDESSAATRSGAFVGTAAYSSPEQLRGGSRAIDARSDVYSLGATLYHALAGKLPYDGHSTTEILSEIERGRLKPLRKLDSKLPRDLETIVATAMESDPARRCANAGELAGDLARLLAFQPIHARPAGLSTRLGKLMRRNRAAALGLIAGSVMSLALATAVVVYLFFVPRWVDEDVRTARLALLDPAYANSIFNLELFGNSTHGDSPLLPPAGFAAALEAYDAALRWSPFDDTLREERDVVAHAAGRAGASAAATNERSAGLSAYLRGDVDAALASWSSWERNRDPRAAADPLIQTLIGVLHLVRDEPARAYPRLREACRVFPNVGFLTTYLADAAVRCGDLEFAESLLAVARDMPRLDPNGALERVTADLYAATGRDREAEELYLRALSVTPATLHYARFLEQRGRVEESIERYVETGAILRGPAVRREIAAALERWWTSQSIPQRRRHIEAAVEFDPSDSHSIVTRCRLVAACASTIPASESSLESRRRASFFVNPARWLSSPSIESVGLTDVARILEVENMTRWNEIPRYSPALKSLQLVAWQSPWPATLSRALQVVAAASAAAIAPLSVAEAQTCNSAPCFQGLGDLPGGAVNSLAIALSSDGTTVVGSSDSFNSDPNVAGELFRWQSGTGMVGLGDLAGATFGGYPSGVSADGNIVTGFSSSGASCASPYFQEAFRWIDGQGILPTGFGQYCASSATGISDDGLTMSGSTGVGGSVMARWTTGGWQELTTQQSHGWGISRDGTWIAGSFNGGSGHEASRHSVATGIELLGDLTGGAYFSQAYSITNASVAVGISSSTNGASEAFRWSPGGPMVGLGDLPGGAFESAAWRISADGSLIVGYGRTAAGQEAVLWDASLSIQRLADVLLCAGVAVPAGWVLHTADDVVINGSVITVCGRSTNANGNPEGWIARFEMPSPAVVAYCTAGTTTNNCTALMSATGTPNVSATSGFVINCTNVEGQKFGLTFYGLSGPKASVWASGSTSYLCVKAPVQRTPSDNSGGTAGLCDGAFSIDFLDYLATHPAALGQPFQVGTRVHAQTWFRDPPAPGTTNLSNGLQFTTLP